MSRNKKKTKAGLPAALAAVVLAVLAYIFGSGGGDSDAPFRVAFIDVGQADCALVVCDGMTMLVDGGNIGDGERIISYLNDNDIDTIDLLVASHPHADHIGGLPEVMEKIKVKSAYLSPKTHTSAVYGRLLDSLDEQASDVHVPNTGDSFMLGRAECTFVGDGSGFDDLNNSSLVMRVDFMEDSILFTGDMETPEEEKLLAENADLRCDILKVGHHGSDTSTSQAFFDAASPGIAVISVGKGNSYGHPSAKTLSRLAVCRIYRTDELGTVVFTSGGSGFTQAGEKRSFELYIVNKRSGVFHRLSCDSLPSGRNMSLVYGRQKAAAQYKPCGRCKP